MGLGGYLIYRLYPERQLFIDSRLLDVSLVYAYWGALEVREQWEELAQRHGFRTIVLSNLRQARLPLRVWLTADPAWKIANVARDLVTSQLREGVAVRPDRVPHEVEGEGDCVSSLAGS